MGSADEKKIGDKIRKIKLARSIRLYNGIEPGQRNLKGKKVMDF